MARSDGSDSPKLHEVTPSETSGRDTIARYQAQFRAAAFECLNLLEDDALDRVYCDYQDDFVSRFVLDDTHIYNFHQVKTKGKRNHQWSTNELLGLRKNAKSADPEKIGNSFIGKLLIHTIKFSNSCGEVVFLTNVHFDDHVEGFIESLQDDSSENRYKELLIENFNEAFTSPTKFEKEKIRSFIKKLNLEPNIKHLDPNAEEFSSSAREAIYKYSEIDLRHGECEEIVSDLVSLVEKKSFSKLVENVDEDDLDDKAGVGIGDMLDILSISQGAYKKLKTGGDPQAIRNASIIHRILQEGGASESMIEFISGCKVDWDIWFRNKRHVYAEYDLEFLQQKIEDVASSWVHLAGTLADLQSQIDNLLKDVLDADIVTNITKELLLGGVFSAIVRNESK